jgi:hypothetical protein
VTVEGFRLTAFLNRIAGLHDLPCLTIYMPTHKVTARQPKDRILLKNLLKEARGDLANRGMRPAEVMHFLKPALDLYKDKLFWEYQGNGLALFLSRDYFEYFVSLLRFDEKVLVSHRFYLKPLLPALLKAERFFLLALSSKEVRLTVVTHSTEDDVLVQKVPAGLSHRSVRKPRHSGRVTEDGMDRRVSAGARCETHPADREGGLIEYFRQTDRAVLDVLGDDKAPLILTGPDYLISAYREANTYSNLIDDSISGNPDSYARGELHRIAREAMEPYLMRWRDEALGRFRGGMADGRVCTDVAPLLQAATEGRVELLLISLKGELTARHDMESGRVDLHTEYEDGDIDVLDEAVARTILAGGTVYAVEEDEMPVRLPLAALLRDGPGTICS